MQLWNHLHVQSVVRKFTLAAIDMVIWSERKRKRFKVSEIPCLNLQLRVDQQQAIIEKVLSHFVPDLEYTEDIHHVTMKLSIC